MSGQEWRVVQSDTDTELYAVRGVYLVAEKLPIEDARLIAAAPELLQAARMLAGLYHGPNNGRSFPTQSQCDFAAAAIAKATGK